MADKIQVAVRVRPVLFLKKDVEVHWSTEKGMVVQVDPATRKRIGNPYLFDQVFGSETMNHQIFNSLVKPLVDSAMDGFNITVLAYGQTASGKTYTMMGSPKELGVVQLVVERIFTVIENTPEREFLLRCSYIEIYNETISDLLSSTHQKLKLQELAEGHVVVHNLIETNVNTTDAVLKLMQQGNKQRKVGGTSMNDRSSRSHTIFRIIVESRPCSEAGGNDAAVIVSHINLVDLAGSEKASQTNATGDRFREGCAINTSLSALSLVIKQLSEGEGFVNFRDSKLTHILRASLGGNARTAIICNVTPTVLDETSSTLKFASSAKTVQNQPHVNEVLSDQALLRKYNNYIKDLEKKLKERENVKKPEAIEEMQRLLQEKDMKIHELKEQLVVSSCSQSAVARNSDQLSAIQRSLRRMTWGGNRLKQLDYSRLENMPFSSGGANHQRATRISSCGVLEGIRDVDPAEAESFVDAAEFFDNASEIQKKDVATMTDSQDSPVFTTPSPFCTPVPVLRERVHSLRKTLEEKDKEVDELKEEMSDLVSFTRLEQEIGVHVNSAKKLIVEEDPVEQLQKARQTANDMEVLYMDTMRKLSDLQTEFREKEVHYEGELVSKETAFKDRLEAETSEKKRLAKDLFELKEKFDRLQRDQMEYDTHINMITERHSKREADLRQNLQEAWSQLEGLGQNPNMMQEQMAAKNKLAEMEQECLAAKTKLAEMEQDHLATENKLTEMEIESLDAKTKLAEADDEKEALKKRLEDLEKENLDARNKLKEAEEERSETLQKKTDLDLIVSDSQVLLATAEEEKASLKNKIQELEKELQSLLSANKKAQDEISSLTQELYHTKERDQKRESRQGPCLDNSLSGMCLADELRDVIDDDCSFVTRSVRPRKRPSSILSIALARMDQSTHMEIIDEIEAKKARLSVLPSADYPTVDVDEITHIKEYLLTLQSELVRYEGDYETLSTEKETLLSELINARKEISTLRSVLSCSPLNGNQPSAQSSSSKSEGTKQAIKADDSNCLMDDDSMSLVISRMDTEHFDASQINEDDDPAEVSQFPEGNITMEWLATQQALKQANCKIQELELSDAAKHKLEDQLRQMSHQLDELHEELKQKTTELDLSRQSLEKALEQIQDLQQSADNEDLKKSVEEARSSIEALSNEKKSLEDELRRSCEELDGAREQLRRSYAEAVEMDISEPRLSTERSIEIQNEIASTLSELESVQRRLNNANSECAELRDANGKLRVELEETRVELQSIASALATTQEALNEANERKKSLEDEMQKCRTEIEELKVKMNLTELQLEETRMELESTCSELQARGDPSSNQQLLDLIKDTEVKLKDSEDRLTELRETLENKVNQLNVSDLKLEEAKSRIRSLEQEANAIDWELQSKLADLDQAHKNLNDLSAKVASTERESSEVQEDLERKLQEALRQVEETNEALRLSNSALDESRYQLIVLKDEISNNSLNMVPAGELADLEAKLKASQDRFETLELTSQEYVRQLGVASEALEQAKDRNLVLEGEAETIKKELESKTDQLRTAERNLDDVSVQLSSLEKATGEQIGDLEGELQLARDRVQDLIGELDRNTLALEESRATVESLKVDLSALEQGSRSDLVKLQSEVENWERQVEELQANLAVKVEQLSTANRELDQAEDRIQHLEADEIAVEGELASKNVALTQEIGKLHSELQAKEEEMFNIRTVAQRIPFLEAKLLEKEEAIVLVSSEMERKDQQIRQIEEKLVLSAGEQQNCREQLQRLEARMAERQKELEKLRISLESMQQENDVLVSRLTDKEDGNVQLRQELDLVNQRIESGMCQFEAIRTEKARLGEQLQHFELELEKKNRELEQFREAARSFESERDIFLQLKQRLDALQAEKDSVSLECQKLGELKIRQQERQEELHGEISALKSQVLLLTEQKVSLEQNQLSFEAHKETFIKDYQLVKHQLADALEQLDSDQASHSEHLNKIKQLTDEVSYLRARVDSQENEPNYKMKEAMEKLRMELVAAQSNTEVLRLNFETEEDNRKKKIERLERELELLKQQYAQCKEQLRFSRFHSNDEPTVQNPKSRANCCDTQIQTDPIADKGFGFRWQMDQYVSDNERLRKKASEIGERMEFYKEKLFKYRNLYFQVTGKDPNQNPAIKEPMIIVPNSNDHSSGAVAVEPERPLKSILPAPAGRFPLPVAPPALQNQQLQDGAAKIPSSNSHTSRWASKKESLTKEEMEKINNCNQS